MKIVAILAFLSATLVGCASGNVSTPPSNTQPPIVSHPNGLWEFWIVNDADDTLVLRSHDPKCMSKEFPSMDVPAHSKVGTVLDTDASGFCSLKDSSFIINYRLEHSGQTFDYALAYVLPWSADEWLVAEKINGTQTWALRVGAPVQTFCNVGRTSDPIECDVKQGRP
jgi:hypothetical protein